jgi:phage head maturation protease
VSEALYIVADLAGEVGGQLGLGTSAPASGVNRDGRTIEGLAIPWNAAGRVHGAPIPVRFPDSAEIFASGNDRLLRSHNRAEAVGRPLWWKRTPAGIYARWRISRSSAGVAALDDAEDGITDGLSVGAEIYGEERGGEFVVASGVIEETSLVAIPAYALARVGSAQ